MATYTSSFFHHLVPGGTNQFTVDFQIPAADQPAEATGDATDDTISVGEQIPVVFTDPTLAAFNGTYEYVGHEPSLPGYIAQNIDTDEYYLFSNVDVLDNQNFNIVAEDIITCFLPGTWIACPEGERAVETLAIGDLVLTADGRSVPVKWLGRQTIVPLFGIPEGRRPVSIEAGALGENLPARELRLTSDHALLLDGVLVHAGALVNGVSIHRMPMAELGERFTVFHIEVENHDVILAEGTPVETFIDNVTRRCFDNYAEYEALFGNYECALEELPHPRAMSKRQVPSSLRGTIATRAPGVAGRMERAA